MALRTRLNPPCARASSARPLLNLGTRRKGTRASSVGRQSDEADSVEEAGTCCPPPSTCRAPVELPAPLSGACLCLASCRFGRSLLPAPPWAAVEFPACPSVPGMVLEGPNATCSFLCFHCCRIPDGQSCSSRRDVVRLRHLPPAPSRGGRGQKSSACTGCVSVGCAYHRAVESRAQRPHTATCRIVAPAVHMARAPALRQACQRAPSNGDPTRRRCMPFSSCCVVHGRLPSAAGSGKWRWSHCCHSLVSGVSDLCCQSCLVLESKNCTASSTTAQGCRVIASPTHRKSWNRTMASPTTA